jgi:hypothetical protein
MCQWVMEIYTAASFEHADLAYANSETFAMEKSKVDGTYGGSDTTKSYQDNGRNYGGADGNTAPDGSAINQ